MRLTKALRELQTSGRNERISLQDTTESDQGEANQEGPPSSFCAVQLPRLSELQFMVWHFLLSPPSAPHLSTLLCTKLNVGVTNSFSNFYGLIIFLTIFFFSWRQMDNQEETMAGISCSHPSSPSKPKQPQSVKQGCMALSSKPFRILYMQFNYLLVWPIKQCNMPYTSLIPIRRTKIVVSRLCYSTRIGKIARQEIKAGR